MTKLITPLLSFDAHGTIGDSVTFQSSTQRKFSRKKPVPADPESALQLAWRQIYRDAVAAWHALSEAERQAWRGVCPGLTGYQCFMSSELKAAPPEPPPVEYTEEQPLSNSSTGLYLSARYITGQRLTIPNRKVSKLAFLLHKFGNPPGNLTFTIRSITPDIVLKSQVWGNAIDLPVDPAWIEVEFPEPFLVNAQVRICTEYPYGDISNCVHSWRTNYDSKGGEYWTRYGYGAWQDMTTNDDTYRYKYFLP